MPLRCRVIRELSDLELVSSDWNRLWRLDPCRRAFQDFGWTLAWIRSFGYQRSLHTFLLYRAEVIVGILPLVLTNGQLRFVGYSVNDYNTILADPRYVDQVVQMALDHLRNSCRFATKIVLENIPEDSPLFVFAKRADGNLKDHLEVQQAYLCSRLVLGENRSDILAGLLNKDSLRRHSKRLMKTGPLEFRHIEDQEEAERHLDAFARQHIRRAALAGRTSLFSGEAGRAFYHELARRLDLRDIVRFSVLEWNGKPVAYHFGLQIDGTYVWYKPAFDVDLWAFSPGEVFLHSLFSFFQRTDTKVFDFTKGDEAFKQRFANVTEYTYDLTIHGSAIWRLISEKARQVLKAAKRVVDSRPASSKAARRIYDVLSVPVSVRLQRIWHNLLRVVLTRQEWYLLEFLQPACKSDKGGFPKPAVQEAKLSDLADMLENSPSLENSEQPWGAIFRERVKNGDKAYAVRDGDAVRALAWVRISPEIKTTDGGPLWRIDAPALVVHELWSARGQFRPSQEEFKNIMQKSCEDTGCRWAAFSLDDAVLKDWNGFRVKSRISYWKLLGWTKRKDVRLT